MLALVEPLSEFELACTISDFYATLYMCTSSTRYVPYDHGRDTEPAPPTELGASVNV